MRLKAVLLAILWASAGVSLAQEVEFRLKKGVLNDSVQLLPDAAPVGIYLPADYNPERKWPLLVYFDYETHAAERIRSWAPALDRQGFVLVHLQAATDSTTLAKSVESAAKLLNKVSKTITLEENMLFTLGTERSSRMASITISLLKGFRGTISHGGQVTLLDGVQSLKGKVFLGAMGASDFGYRTIREDWSTLNSSKRARGILVLTEGKVMDSSAVFLERNLALARLDAMKAGILRMDSTLLSDLRAKSLALGAYWISRNRLLLAENEWELQQEVLDLHIGTSWNEKLRELGLQKEYRLQDRRQRNLYYQEAVLWARFWDYLQEDLELLQLDNLGWWNFQISKLNQTIREARDLESRESAERTLSYLSALVDDQLILLKDRQSEFRAEELASYERYLYMIKTLLEPDNHEPYLAVISRSAQIEDFGTALYYLDLLFQKGFTDTARLYGLQHTALFRLSPEFNELLEKYLNESRY